MSIDALPITRAAAEDLSMMLASLRRAQALVAGAIVRVGARADELASEGRAPPGSELLGADGAVRGRTARDEAARSKVLRRLPALAGPLRQGRIGPDRLDVLARGLGRVSDDDLGRLDVDQLVADAVRLPADTFAAAVRRAARDASVNGSRRDAAAKRAASTFRHWFDERTGMGCFRGELDPERYELLISAVDRRTSALASAADEPTSKTANLAATALVDLIGRSDSAGRPPSAQLIVVVGDGIEPQTSSGHPLSGDAIERMACNALIRRVSLDRKGVPLDVGRAHRTATDRQWAAIRALYPTCAWAGCGQRIDWCQLHHIVPWGRGGATDLHNLVPLCSEHHHRVHEGRWTIELLSDRSLRIVRPDGELHTTTDPPRRSGSAQRPPPVKPPPPGNDRSRNPSKAPLSAGVG